MLVCCEGCVLSGRGLCDGLTTRPEESYRLWRVVVCDQETSKNKEAKARYRAVENTTTMGCNARKTNKQYIAFTLSSAYFAYHLLREGGYGVVTCVESSRDT
jgi:hypothetical protein